VTLSHVDPKKLASSHMTCYCAECDRSKVKPDGLTYLGDQPTNFVPRIPPVSELKVVGTDSDRTISFGLSMCRAR